MVLIYHVSDNLSSFLNSNLDFTTFGISLEIQFLNFQVFS